MQLSLPVSISSRPRNIRSQKLSLINVKAPSRFMKLDIDVPCQPWPLFSRNLSIPSSPPPRRNLRSLQLKAIIIIIISLKVCRVSRYQAQPHFREETAEKDTPLRSPWKRPFPYSLFVESLGLLYSINQHPNNGGERLPVSHHPQFRGVNLPEGHDAFMWFPVPPFR